jgi:hypothetical protein
MKLRFICFMRHSPFTMNLFPILLASFTALHAEADPREFSSKKASFNLATGMTAKQWERDITQEDWLKLVTSPDTELLHGSKTDDFYFAIFRKDRHLILWAHDRNCAYSGCNTSVIDSNGKSVRSPDEPSKWAVLNTELKLTSDKINDKPLADGTGIQTNVIVTNTMLGDVFEIDPAFQGDLIVRLTLSSKEKPAQTTYLLKANWK